MATLHVRNVPEDLYEEIRARAEAESRSVSAEILVLLSRAVGARPAPSEVRLDIRRRRSFRPAAVGAPDSTTLLREDRER